MIRQYVWLTSVPLLLIPVQLDAQRIDCQLHRSAGDTIQGECRAEQVENPILDKFFPAPVQLYPGEDGGAEWVGWMMLGDRRSDLTVESYSYWSGPATILKAPFGWFIPDNIDLQGGRLA